MTGETQPRTDTRDRKRRRLHRILLIVGAIVLFLAGLLVVAPRYVGRLILAHYVEDLGIDVEGTRTFDIELLRGRISFGPARFSLGDADPGQITSMALQFFLPPVFQRRALLTTLVIDGLQLRVAEDAEHKITINGVPLRTLLPPPDEAAGAKEKEESGWGAGLDSFELRNSEVVYFIPDRGEARLAIDRLDLIGFRTWQPDKPGTFAIEGNLNEIPIRMQGEAWPFAEETHVRLAFSLEAVEWPKIERFTGDLGLQPNAGRLNVSGAGELRHEPATGADFSVTGELSVAGLDVARAEMGQLAMEQASGTYALRTRISPTGEAGTAGSVSFQAASGRMALPDGLSFTFDRAILSPTDLKLDVAADDSLALQAKPTVELSGASLSGPAAVSAATLNLAFDPVDLAMSPKGAMSLNTAGAVTGTEVKAAPSGGDAGGTTVRSSEFKSEIGQLAVETQDGRLKLDGRVSLTSPMLGASLGAGSEQAPAQTIELSATKVDLARVGVEGGADASSITAEGTFAADSLSLTSGQVGGGDAASLAADAVALTVEGLGLATTPSAMTVAGGASLTTGSVDLKLPAVPVQPTVRIAGLSFQASELDGSIKPEAMHLKSKLKAEIKQPNAGWRTVLPVAGGKAASSTATAQAVRIDSPSVDLRAGGAGHDIEGDLTIAVDRLALRSPAFVTMAGGAIDVGAGQVKLRELRHGKPKPESWRVAVDATLSDLRAGGEEPIPRFKAARLETEGFSIDDRGAIDLGDLVISNADAAISTAWITRLGGDPAAKEVAERAERTAETKPVRIEGLRVENGVTIDFFDTSIKPPAHFEVQVKAFELGTLDTTKPQGRTDVYLRATLNEFTPVEVQGWVTPIAEKQDFALAARVQELQLPPLSPYTLRAAGLNIESGSLKVDADAAADAGKLSGVLRLNVGSLAVQSASAEEASKVEQTIGLPVGAAIGLIQDDEGRIKLDIPLSGDLASPAFDFGDAIGQAVTNVMKAAVLAPFRLALLPVTVIAGAADAGAPQLPPIPFSAGEATLDAQASAALERLAQVLSEHAKVRVKVCGRATGGDRTALAAVDAGVGEGALRALAEARTLAVRRALIEAHRVSADQVLDCRATYAPDDSGQPRVDIEF